MKTKITILLITILLSSCATVFTGTRSKIKVQQGNVPAQVFLNGNLIGTAPCKVKVPKHLLRNGKAVLTIKAEGYKDAVITLDGRVRVGWVVFDILTGVVGLAVDFATGAIYKADHKTVTYQLEKKD